MTLRSMRSHVTDACEHSEDSWCIRCEQGCSLCGTLEDINDDSLCEKCAFEDAVSKADMLYDSMKDRD